MISDARPPAGLSRISEAEIRGFIIESDKIRGERLYLTDRHGHEDRISLLCNCIAVTIEGVPETPPAFCVADAPNGNLWWLLPNLQAEVGCVAESGGCPPQELVRKVIIGSSTQRALLLSQLCQRAGNNCAPDERL
jgi:hypothetical protein